ncbi:MAG: glutamate synthase subunit beta [Pseudomonadota bacterium]|uniref:Glutamate synthase subunit beta n=1 Tax=Candidatus Desulfatibia profunda TaxID=2841695 RepID=A0A8J6TK76_9BACT|nr:glutamate synthase subunit beta [Candidatus Desulfatibia profunda]MBL7180826.1 glutamate synthase subunit beta [Desulfobacterales bacterium]
MGKPTGFKEFERELPLKRPVKERIGDFKEIYLPFPEENIKQQTARCMDCGVPTCHSGCPLANQIPDWNDLVYRGRWQEAAHRLHQTNNFPEFTGRLCPAPCEEACVLAINEPPVTIEQIEKEIIEHAFQQDWVRPEPPKRRTNKTVAVIGSGPAGLACAQQLNRAGHTVTVFERDDRIGGLLRYGIPEFKLEKWVLDRRLDLLSAEGIRFKSGVHAGIDLTVGDFNVFDATVLCLGATRPRDLPIPGRDLAGIHFAMDFLTLQNRRTAGNDLQDQLPITAAGKHVVVIGGGDTGNDCIGTCHRQGARSVVNFELLPRPSADRTEEQPWPFWPMRLRTSSSHEEGGRRYWSLLTKAFEGSKGKINGLVTVDVTFDRKDGAAHMQEVPGSERRWPVDLVLLALGFAGPETHTIIDQFGLELNEHGNIKTDADYAASKPGIFACGDARRGQSLIVWAISEGREAARAVDIYLMGTSNLPTKGCCDLPQIP